MTQKKKCFVTKNKQRKKPTVGCLLVEKEEEQGECAHKKVEQRPRRRCLFHFCGGDLFFETAKKETKLLGVSLDDVKTFERILTFDYYF